MIYRTTWHFARNRHQLSNLRITPHQKKTAFKSPSICIRICLANSLSTFHVFISLHSFIPKSYQHTPPLPHAMNHLFLRLVPSNRLLNCREQRLRVSTNDLLDLLLVLEDQECRHGADAELLRDIRDLVDVQLHEVGAGELF